MLKYLFYLSIGLFIGCGSAMKAYEVIPAKKIDEKRLNFAHEMSLKLLTKMKEGSFYPLTEEEATPQMVRGLNEDLQRLSYMQIEAGYGEFRSMEFYELVKEDSTNGNELYRFRSTFGQESLMEVRSVLDKQGKLAGFFVLPWSEHL